MPPRRRRHGAACGAGLALLAVLLAARPAAAEEGGLLTQISEVGAALHTCWKAPAGSQGSRITLLFGLSADGRLKGPPRATYSQLAGTPDDQRAFVAAALLALERCTPLRMRADLARVVASRVLTVTFVSPVPSLGI